VDIVVAKIPKGKFASKRFGRVTIRQRKSFILNGFDVNPDYLKRVHQYIAWMDMDTKPKTRVERET
jgi:hypothetical protein